jgi:hypothetical protein
MQPRDCFFHAELQDTSAAGWLHLLTLIDEAAADGRETFRPREEMSPEECKQVITLPPTIANLVEVKHLDLYRSNLVRLPPEIGEMTSLEKFTPYTSYRLHWFPYELTRCSALRESTVSTRALYKNFKNGPPLPELLGHRFHDGAQFDPANLDPAIWGATAVERCSVCRQPIGETGPFQGWVSLWVATDILPLLVNAWFTRVPRSGASGYS